MKNSRVALAAVLLAVGVAVTGCSASAGSGESGSGGSSAGSRSSATAPDAAGDGTVKAGGFAEPASGAAKTDRSVVVVGTVTVTASDPIRASEKAATIVEDAGGRIDGRTETAAANGDRGSATLVLRIPAARLTETLTKLRALGRADQVQIDSTDVTTQTQDLDARITASRATIARLLQLESTATDTTNLIAIETAIGDRQADLESMEAQQRGLADQVSMSTITLQLRSDAAAPPLKPADFWSGLGTGWNGFVAFWAAVLVGVGVIIPWLVLAGAATAAVLLVRRALRRRRAQATPSAPIG